MNCRQFTSFIVEAARGRMMDAAARDAAMRHADACAACASRLAQEQSLTAALRAVAHDMKDLSAPAGLEAKLLAAFAESHAPANAPAATTNDAPAPLRTSVQPTAHASLRTRRFTRAAMAIAASLVLVALAALYTQFTRTTPSPPGVATKVEPERGAESAHVNTATISTPPLAPPGGSTALPEGERPEVLRRRDVATRASGKLARGATPRMITAAQVIDGGNAIIEADEGETSRGVAGSTAAGMVRPNEPESMTDFISLVADATPAMPLDGGQLVRVQVPRAALASMGLPLNAERGYEPVQADVLVGNDGLARAIRFVR